MRSRSSNNLLRVLLLLFSFHFYAYATSIDRSLAVSLAKDAYEMPRNFAPNYPGFKISYDVIGGLSLYLLEDSQGRAIVLFRGTDVPKDWLTNLSIQAVPFENHPQTKVHSGYYYSALAVYHRLRPLLQDKREIIVVGHSLGGSVGLMFSALLYDHGFRNLSLFSFGAPPVGNQAFVDLIKDLEHYRYVYWLDLVPQLNDENIAKLKELVAYVESLIDAKSYEKTIQVLRYIESVPYDFVHHGKELTVRSIRKPDNFDAVDILLLPLFYHSMENYEKSFDQDFWFKALDAVIN